MAGEGLKGVCKALGIPPVLHMGSCVDISRILVAAAAIANALGVDISDLPAAGAAPEWMSEKAVAIGAYVVGSGVYHRAGNCAPRPGKLCRGRHCSPQAPKMWWAHASPWSLIPSRRHRS